MISMIIFVVFGIPTASASPCDGIDRSLTRERKINLAPVIARQLHAQKLHILGSFRSNNWNIILVRTYVEEDVFLFYADDPKTNGYVTKWGGVALDTEEQEVRDWTVKNAPGIPPPLAGCFAWAVTHFAENPENPVWRGEGR